MTIKNIHTMKHSLKHTLKGFSLIELLIAMTLGSIISLAAYNIYFSTKQSLALLEAESRMQENARFVFSFIAVKLKEAGNFGCQIGTEDTMENLVNTTSNTFRPWRSIEGWEATDSGYNDTYNAVLDDTVITANTSSHWEVSTNAEMNSGIKSKRKSDILRIWYTSKEKTPLSSASGGILTFPAIDLKQGNVLVINDCAKIKLAQVCRCDTTDTECNGNDQRADLNNCSTGSGSEVTPGNSTVDLSDINISTAEIRILKQAIFYVSKRGSGASQKFNLPSLYWKKISGNLNPTRSEEILEGVESIQLLYGEDTDGDKAANYYVSANSVIDWNNITSIRISLLLISNKPNLISDTQSLSFNNQDITFKSSDDRHLRKVFTTTIALRNRITGG